MLPAMRDYSGAALIPDFAERTRATALSSRMAEIDSAPRGQKTAVMALVARQEGLTFKTLERKYAAWRKGGDLALADGRKLARHTSGNEFYAEFKTYAERNLNTTKGGYVEFMKDLRAGKVFAFGTWRDLWRKEFPYEPLPAFCPSNWTPRGLSYNNMDRLFAADPTRAISCAWSRQGQFAALRHVIPVVRSRAGLPVGAVYQADDVWHNIDVFQAGIKGVFNPLEFAIYDVASAYKAVSAMKPRTLTVGKDGKETRDNLKEIQFRFALSFLVCCVGFHKDGVTFVLERGTTAIRDNVRRRIAGIPGWGPLFKFQTSGVKNTPACKGMFVGNAGGNPRMKSLCECAHNIMHNATAALPGSHGRDAAHLHESTNALVKYSEDIIAQAEQIDKALLPLLELPILDYRVYQQYFYQIEDAVMDRHDHKLEGWQENEEMCYRLGHGMEWRAASELVDMAPEQAAAIKAYLTAHPEDMCMRKMSRREVWAKGQKDMVKLPLFELPSFLDPRDVREAVVRADSTISFEDAVYYPGRKMLYLAEYTDRGGLRHRIAPGQKVRFYWNPLGDLSRVIWIADDDEEHSVLGIAPALKTALWRDDESIKAAMGQQNRFIAEMMASTRAGRSEDVAREVAMRAYNAALIERAKQAQNDAASEAGEESEDSGAERVSFEALAGAEREAEGHEEEERAVSCGAVSFEDLARV